MVAEHALNLFLRLDLLGCCYSPIPVPLLGYSYSKPSILVVWFVELLVLYAWTDELIFAKGSPLQVDSQCLATADIIFVKT